MKKKKSFQNPVVPLPRALTSTQAVLIEAIKTKEMVITTGPAGTGKTYIPAAMAAHYYHAQKVKRIVLTRPTLGVDGRTNGFFPGDILEKMLPWTTPFLKVLEEHLGKGQVECMIKNGKIEIVPFEVIRGQTFDDSFVILDEAQNTTMGEIKAFVTRIGEDSKVVINGDISQSDLANKNQSGLQGLVHILQNGKTRYAKLNDKVSIVTFTIEDVVRSEICKLWLQAFEEEKV